MEPAVNNKSNPSRKSITNNKLLPIKKKGVNVNETVIECDETKCALKHKELEFDESLTPTSSPEYHKSYNVPPNLGKSSEGYEYLSELKEEEKVESEDLDIDKDQMIEQALDNKEIKSVIDILTAHGYQVQEKIVTKNLDGNLLVRYLKVLSPQGQYIYIELDNDGYVSLDEDDILLREISDKLFSYDLKVKSYECINPSNVVPIINTNNNCVAGVLMECPYGICSLTRTNEQNAELLEENFLVDDKMYQSGGPISKFDSDSVDEYDEDSSPNPVKLDKISEVEVSIYPIIRLSTIINDDSKGYKNNIHDQINESISRIQERNFRQCQYQIDQTPRLINNYLDTLKSFIYKENLLVSNLNKTLNLLNDLKQQFEHLDIMTENNTKKYESIKYNLKKRVELKDEISKICKEVAGFNLVLNKEIESVNLINKYLDVEFQDIDKDLS